MNWRLLSILLLTLLLTACGTTSRLKSERGPQRAIADFTAIRIEPLSDHTRHKRKDSQEKRAAHRARVAEAAADFAQRIAEQLREEGVFEQVDLAPQGDADALILRGRMERFAEGNAAARLAVGFAGQSHFEALIEMVDPRSGEVLARMHIDRNSWPLPVGTAVAAIQTVGFHMEMAARKLRDELMIAKGMKARSSNRR